MQIIISNDAKSAITDIYDYSYNISSNYASRIINQIYELSKTKTIKCGEAGRQWQSRPKEPKSQQSS